MITLQAATLARGWLAVATANEKGANTSRPALWRTIHIQQYPHGLRLTATDSYMLLSTWIPEAYNDLEPEPQLDEIPWATAIAIDEHNRATGLLGHLLTLARSDDHKDKLEVNVQLNVPWQPDDVDPADRQLDGFEALAVRIEYPDHESVQLRVYEGRYPSLAPLLTRKPVKTDAVALSQKMCARLGKAAAPHGDPLVKCRFTGRNKPVLVEFGDEPPVRGLAMPCRWDLDADVPELPAADEIKAIDATSREVEK